MLADRQNMQRRKLAAQANLVAKDDPSGMVEQNRIEKFINRLFRQWFRDGMLPVLAAMAANITFFAVVL